MITVSSFGGIPDPTDDLNGKSGTSGPAGLSGFRVRFRPLLAGSRGLSAGAKWR
jgi:hypothetical protein